jgi:lysophospholipase L1-like esterase
LATASPSAPARHRRVVSGQLQALIGKVVNAGVPGEVSADGLARLPEVLDEAKPKLLLLCHGGNDFLRKQRGPRWRPMCAP